MRDVRQEPLRPRTAPVVRGGVAVPMIQVRKHHVVRDVLETLHPLKTKRQDAAAGVRVTMKTAKRLPVQEEVEEPGTLKTNNRSTSR